MDSGSAVARDSAVPPEQPVLLAEVDGHVLAALVLSDGTVVADSFHPTPDLIDLLSARPGSSAAAVGQGVPAAGTHVLYSESWIGRTAGVAPVGTVAPDAGKTGRTTAL